MAEEPSKPPANIEEFLWNVHSTLVAQPGPLPLDQFKDQYSELLGHKCTIERFLVVGDGGLAATLKRIPHVVTLVDSGGTQCVKATQPAGIDKKQLSEADKKYRLEIQKRNAAKAAAMGTSKAKAAAPAASAGAPAKAAAPVPAEAKRPAEAAAPDAKKAKSDNESETLARMLVQGVVRVLQNRAKVDKGALPISELEEEFKALWKVPFNLQQAGETDTVTFLRKWQSKVELIQEGDTYLVQLAKKVAEKPKAGEAAAAKGVTTAVKAGSIAKAPAAAKSAPAPVPAKAPVIPAVPAVQAVPAATAPPADSAETEAKNGPSVPKRAGGPTRPPASIEDFLWNVHSVIAAFAGPMPLDQLKDAYSKHHGHRCAIERFLVVGEGGLAATLKRIPHVVHLVTDPQTNDVTLKSALPDGATKETLIKVDLEYRKELQQKLAAAKSGAAAPPAQTATAAKSSAAAPEGESAAKKARTEDPETLARMLIQGVARVLQNRQKEGKGALPVNDLESEFKALWKVPFNLQQAGETDTVEFLRKWPLKVEVVEEGGVFVVQLAKKAAEKAKAVAPSAPKAAPKATPKGALASTAASEPAVAAPARGADAVGDGALRQRLPELRQQAASMLTSMREMVQKQEALVKALNELSPGGEA